MLYCPRRYNFRGIGGIIVWIEPERRRRDAKQKKRKLLIFPLQITLAPDAHSDSHETFFNQYTEWIKNLEEFDVVPEFIWITPEPTSFTIHDENSKLNWPKHNERYVNLDKVNHNIWVQYQAAKKSQMIQKAPKEQEGIAGGLKERARPGGHGTAVGTSDQEARRGGGIGKCNQVLSNEQSDAEETKKVEGRKQGGKKGRGTRSGRS